MSKFTASFLRGASLINPDSIEITDGFVVFKKRKLYLIGYDTIIMKFSFISSVEINTGIIGTNIIIQSFGGGIITGHRFTLEDALEIERLIKEQTN